MSSLLYIRLCLCQLVKNALGDWGKETWSPKSYRDYRNGFCLFIHGPRGDRLPKTHNLLALHQFIQKCFVVPSIINHGTWDRFAQKYYLRSFYHPLKIQIYMRKYMIREYCYKQHWHHSCESWRSTRPDLKSFNEGFSCIIYKNVLLLKIQDR